MATIFFTLLVLCSSALGAIHERFEDLPTSNFDFIIVGGGLAGNVLANRLTENANISVLVLEAGVSTADVQLSEVPFFCTSATPETPLDWNFTTTEQPGLNGRSISFPRGFGLGGSTAVNYMFYTRGPSQDYDRYAEISGDPGWGWEALQPYILKNEHLVPPSDNHNTTGQFDPAVHSFTGITSVSLPGVPRDTDSHVIQTTSNLPDEFPFNLDYNSGHHLGIGWAPYTVGNGTRSSSETSYLAATFIGRPNLHVLTNAYVTRILQSVTQDTNVPPTFDAVEFTQDAGATLHTLAPIGIKEIIVSAGAIGTPNVLLHSGIGDATELTALGITPTLNLPDVGKNLTDHPLYTGLSFFVNSTDTIENVYFRNATFEAETLAEWQTNRTGFLSSGLANQVGFLRVPEDAGILDGDPCAGNETGHFELIFTNGILTPFPPPGDFFGFGVATICPLSRGNVTINSVNPLDPPLINPNYLSHPQDIAIMQQAIATATKFVTSAAWDGYTIGVSSNNTDDDLRNGVGSFFHPVGTASMSPADASWGVVNPDLKLKGAKGVRIVDASILPLVPAGHSQAPVYAFAERAADLIKADIS
ncbi:aryl-alcohol oxidase precursor [Armillaria novae-zelandiae]|uniref:Aryl-alcohol oxidase n=1 Tax=Armillaria novae-zelandiae TaxID=153914 RepID=A0AA39P7W8_9AGAR|nr:aryl-alcohol oxidase precursor [Armillaria novae-zelandiae]